VLSVLNCLFFSFN